MILMLVLVLVGALLLIRALLLHATVREARWQPAMLAIVLLLTALVGYTIPIVTLAPSMPVDSTSQPSNDTSVSLQATLLSLSQADSHANPAYTTLLADYITYHAVLVVEGSIFTLLLIGLSIYGWRRFKHVPMPKRGYWTFERRAYAYFGLASTLIALGMVLIVAANLSNVVNAQAGFAQVIPELGRAQASSQNVGLHQAVDTWAQAGNAATPALLQNAVHNRLMWQRPKAIVASILLVVFTIFTVQVWQRLIRDSRVRQGRWNLKAKARLTLGLLAVPVTGLLMLMALANTQAALAPLTLTLLFG